MLQQIAVPAKAGVFLAELVRHLHLLPPHLEQVQVEQRWGEAAYLAHPRLHLVQ